MSVAAAPRRRSLADWLRLALVALAYLYVVGLAAWLLIWAAWGDRWPWLFAVTTLAAYLFMGLPITGAIALGGRRADLALWTALGVLAWAAWFGRQFVPRAAAEAHGPSVRVLTMNVLGYRTDTQGVIDSIRAANADVVTIQELNEPVAAAIERDLAEAYPFQLLRHAPGVTGAGILSRLPFTPTGQLPGPWLGPAQVVTVRGPEGHSFTLVRAHTHSGPDDVGTRNAASEVVAQYVLAHPGPTIVAGDFNTTPLTDAYRTLTSVLKDSWAEAGWGLGHTFPGADSNGSSRPRLLGVLVPMWLVRIDYVFHTDDFVTRSAVIGPWDGISDHRPVLVELAFR
jgi:endonuclease/exonuclease/phosphatase (EEP) superfamily protein YafD